MSVQTKEDFLRGVSVPINPELTSVFMKIDKAEASGKGINTIVEKYGKEVFEFNETHFTIKIPYNKKVLEVFLRCAYLDYSWLEVTDIKLGIIYSCIK